MILEQLKKAGIDLVASLPDQWLGGLIAECEADSAITHIRRSTRTPRKTELAETTADARHIEEHLSREEVHQLHEGIATLTDVDKAIILLHLEEQNYDEIASVIGLTKTNVSVRLVRIKRALKEYFKENSDAEEKP